MIGLVAVICLVVGLLIGAFVGAYWTIKNGPKTYKEKLDVVFQNFQKDVEAETERQRQIQDAITKQYQKAIQQAIYDHMMETAEPPSREEMN